MRELPPAQQVSRDRWVTGFRIDELPDLGADGDSPSAVLLRRYWTEWQVGLLQGLGRRTPDGAYAQLRFSGHGGADAAVDIELRCVASTSRLAWELGEQVSLSLPEMLGTSPLESHSVSSPSMASIADDVTPPLRSTCDIRRGRVTIEPEEGYFEADAPSGYSFPWPVNASALISTMALLAEQEHPTDLLIDLRPVAHDPSMAAHLRECVETALGEEKLNPFRRDVMNVYLARLRDLSVSGFEIRLSLTSTVNLPAGLPDAVAVTLSQLEAYVLSQPTTRAELFRRMTQFQAFRWPMLSEELEPGERLTRVWSLREVTGLFNVPLAPTGGLLHVASARVRRLPRSPQAQPIGPAVSLGLSPAGTPVALSNDDLNRHLLIAGLPGFGKSTTVRAILRGLAAQGTAFLVLDPAKEDYASLVGELERTHPRARFIRLEPGLPAFNPLIVPPGCSPAAHVGRLLAAFDSSLQISARWPVGYALLGRAIAETVARDRPTLEGLKKTVRSVVERDGFTGVTKSEILGSLLGRLDFMTSGPLGVALSADASAVDWDGLMSAPAVISLRMFSGPSERSLLFGLLFANLVSYREAHPLAGGLGHVIVLEEAHRLIGADSAASEGARLFVEALAELRGSGQGFVVVDQAPTELHPLVTKICGSMLSHRLVSKSEREAAAAALTLDDRQSEDLAHLDRGEVVLHSSNGRMPVTARVEGRDVGSLASEPAADRSLLASPRLDPIYCVNCRGACRNIDPELRRWRPTQRSAGVEGLVAELRKGNPHMSDEQLLCAVLPHTKPRAEGDHFTLVPALRHLIKITRMDANHDG